MSSDNVFDNLNNAFIAKRHSPKQYSNNISLINFNVIGAFFGILFLTGSVMAGTLLVVSPQLFNQQAQTVTYGTPYCEPERACSYTSLVGSEECIDRNYTLRLFCCGPGKVILDDFACGDMPSCNPGDDCPDDPDITGTKLCKEGDKTRICCPTGKVRYNNTCLPICDSKGQCSSDWADGSRACVSQIDNQAKYCCGTGQILKNNMCLSACDTGVACSLLQTGGSIRCFKSGTTQTKYCCQSSLEVISNGMCTIPSTIPRCDTNASCGYTYVSQSVYCLKSTSTGTTAMHCCPSGFNYAASGCVPKIPCPPEGCSGQKPPGTPVPKPTPTPAN